MSTLKEIAKQGNAPDRSTGERAVPNRITCADGFSLSVIAGPGNYCSPRPALLPNLPADLANDAPADYPGPYTAVEVGFPSARPEPWADWLEYVEDPDDPTATVYGYVPVETVQALIELHGGESRA